MIRLYVLLLLVSTLSFGIAQDAIIPAVPAGSPDTVGPAPPDGPMELRSFDAARIEELRQRIDHDRDLRHTPTLWERLKERIGQWLRDLFGSRIGAMVTDNLLYIFIVVTLVFALVMLSKGGLRRVFHGAPRSLGEVAVSEEDIREMDLEAAIAQAETDGDTRRAIRLHYLLVLRGLVERGVLDRHPHYTDEDLMAQIKEPALRARFSHVALIFQWVWYGQAHVSPARYEDLRRPFLQFEMYTAK